MSIQNDKNSVQPSETYQTIQNILRGKDSEVQIDIGENILHYYDNYTYHIKFYMVEQGAAQKYMDERRSLNNTTFENMSLVCEKLKAVKKKSIIIAETGKTEDIIINSLTLDTITSVPNRGISTTAEATLTLTEIGGCSLINKITYASHYLGQESYVKSIYFIDLWFSGYVNKGYSKKTIEEKIPFTRYRFNNNYDVSDGKNEEEFLTFAMIPCDVKTKQDGLNTVYTFKLVGLNFNLHTPSVSLSNMEKLTIEKGSTFKSTIDDFEKKLNKSLKETLLPGARDIYGNNPVVHFNIVDNSGNELASKTVNDSEGNENQSGNSYEGSNATNIISNNSSSVNPKPNSEKSSDSDGSPSKSKIDFNIDKTDNISTAINKLWNLFHPLSGCIPLVNITQTNVSSGSSGTNSSSGASTSGAANSVSTITTNDSKIADFNMVYSKYEVDINIKKIPGLEIRKRGMKKNANPYWTETIIEEQREVLKGLSAENAIKRRYYNNYTGENIDILNYTEDDDTMWYLNTSLGEQELITSNKKNIISDDEKKSSEKEKKYSESYSINESTTINDLWDNKGNIDVIKTVRNGAIGPINIFEPQKTNISYGETKEDDANAKKTSNDESQSIARIGAANFFSHAQKIKLKVSIIGDPYWLEFGSEMRESQFSDSFPHVIFVANTPYKLDKRDNYVQDKFMTWASLYKIIKIKSHFEGGKFTQDIEGVIAPSFVFKDNFKSQKPEKAENSVAGVSVTNENVQIQSLDPLSVLKEKNNEEQSSLYRKIVGLTERSTASNNGEDVLLMSENEPLKYYFDNKTNEYVVVYAPLFKYGEHSRLSLDKYDVKMIDGKLIATNKETNEMISFNSLTKIDPNVYSDKNEYSLAVNADKNGNVDGKIYSYSMTSNGDVEIRINNGSGVYTFDKSIYDVDIVKTDGDKATLKIMNKNYGKTYLLNGATNFDTTVINDYKNENNPVLFYGMNDTIVVKNLSNDSSKIYALGNYDEDGTKSSFNHSYSIYAEVKMGDGTTTRCYSENDLKNVIGSKTYSNISINKETYGKNDIENLVSYDKLIEGEKLNMAFRSVNNLNVKEQTHNNVN